MKINQRWHQGLSKHSILKNLKKHPEFNGKRCVVTSYADGCFNWATDDGGKFARVRPENLETASEYELVVVKRPQSSS